MPSGSNRTPRVETTATEAGERSPQTKSISRNASRDDLPFTRRRRSRLAGVGGSDRAGTSTTDPRRPDRIVYASTTPCGTFFLDAKTERSLVLAPVPVIVHAAEDDSPEFAGSNPWSPDGRHVWLGNDIANPIVVDLEGGERIDLTDAVSAGGQRRPMTALMWSPDGDQVEVIVQPGGYNDPDRDLVAITLSPLRAGYVATLTESAGHGLVLWTTADVAWHDDHLVVPSRDRRASIIMKSPGQLGWTPTRAGAPPVALEGAACP